MIKFLAIFAVLAAFLVTANPASAHTRRHHRHHKRIVYVTRNYGYGSNYYGYSRPGYYSTGYGYYGDPYYGNAYYGRNYYYGRPYYRRPAVSFSIGF